MVNDNLLVFGESEVEFDAIMHLNCVSQTFKSVLRCRFPHGPLAAQEEAIPFHLLAGDAGYC